MTAEINKIIDQISKKFHPYKIILFGSHAYGNADKESDIDLLVVMDYQGSSRKQAVSILQEIDYHIPLDLLVRSNKQIKERINAGDFFINEIMNKGKILYEQNLS
jgi:predicted nucleotidyltransferase